MAVKQGHPKYQYFFFTVFPFCLLFTISFGYVKISLQKYLLHLFIGCGGLWIALNGDFRFQDPGSSWLRSVILLMEEILHHLR